MVRYLPGQCYPGRRGARRVSSDAHGFAEGDCQPRRRTTAETTEPRPNGATRMEPAAVVNDATHMMQPLTHPPDCAVRIPGSKSITNRALLIAALADGSSVIEEALFSDDTHYKIG